MASVRARVTFRELDYSAITVKIDNVTITYDESKTAGCGLSTFGLAVTLSADGTVALAVDQSVVLGKLLRVEKDNFATVQVDGGMILPKATSAPTYGTKIVGGLLVAAKGYVRSIAAAGGAYAQAAALDTQAQRGIVLDAGAGVTCRVGETEGVAGAAIWLCQFEFIKKENNNGN